ncbi:MAG: hypothetical protein GWP91_10460, partial [Rhodobacterales bacterium]|nr:hypothetical protein [Rhodobacterales bacterium]
MYAAKMDEACGKHALRFSATENTGKCLSIISASDAERTMLTDLGAAICLPELGDFTNVLGNSRVAHFTGYTLLPGPMQAVALQAIKHAHQNGVRVSIDAADPFVVSAIRDLLWEVFEIHADIVFLNADEARQLTKEDPENAIHTIAKRAALDTVVVKLGSQGSLVWHDGEVHKVGVHKVNAIDTTGAGDAYAGGFLFGLTRGWSAADCGELGSAVAALTVSQIGAVVKDHASLQAAIKGVQGNA